MRADKINSQCEGVALIIDDENIQKAVKGSDDLEIKHYNPKALVWKAKTHGEIIVAKAYLPLDYEKKRVPKGNKIEYIFKPRISKFFYKNGNREIDISQFYQKLPPKVKRKIDRLRKNEITPVHTSKISKNGRSNSSADYEIYCDVMDLSNRQDIKTIVLVTSDKDFIPLIKRIAEKKKEIVIIGVNGSASENFIKECKQYGKYHNYIEVHTLYLAKLNRK